MTVSEPLAPRSERRTSRLTLPFIDTGPLFDLRWLILLLPIWWALGVEQFIWPAGLGLVSAKVILLQRGRIAIYPPLKWFALFLAAVLISSLFIVESFRWLTFVRNLGAYVAGFLLFLVVTNRARTWTHVSRLLDAALIALIVAAMVGLLAILDIWRPSFQSLAGNLLPGWVAATSYGQEIATRVVGQRGWFVGLGEYYRLSGFFLFATHYASIIVYAIPFLIFRFAHTRGIKRLVIGGSIILLLVNLVFTTGRVSMVSLLAGGVYFMLFHSLSRKVIRFLAVIGLLLLILALLLSAFLELTSPGQEGVITNTIDAAETFLFARGAGSFISRFAVYEASLSGFIERPLFGWGTERDVPGLEFPAGSHSEYIAVLYRQGLFGTIAFLGLLWSTWRHSRPVRGERARSAPGGFLRYGRWFFATALVNSIAADPVIDTTVYVFLWLFLSLMVATATFIRKEAASGPLTG